MQVDENSSINWSSGEPNNYDDKEYCAVVNKRGMLNDMNCFKARPFMCDGSHTRSSSFQVVDAESAVQIKEQQGFQVFTHFLLQL